MWGWIIKVTLISILLIFLLHYLYSFFKATLTSPKLKDLVNKPLAKYNTIYNSLKSAGDGGSQNLGEHEDREENDLHDVIERYENGELNSGDDLLKQYLKLLNFNSRLQYDSFALIQYVYCAIENYDTEISTSTNINRFKLFELIATEISDERKYQNWSLSVPALDLDMMTKMQSGIMADIWQYDPDAGSTDYGDSNFLGMEDIEIQEVGLSEYRKPLVIE
jgi:hypothetical protein